MSESAYPKWLTVAIIAVVSMNFSLFLFALRVIHEVWKIKDETYIRARKIRAALYCSIPLLFIMIIHPVLLCLYFWVKSYNTIINTIIHILVMILAIVPLICVAFRLWLFYYKRKLSEAYFKEKRMVFQQTIKEELGTPAGNRQSVSPFVSRPNNAQHFSHFTSDSNNTSYPDIDSSNVPISSHKTAEDLIKMESTIINPLQFWINHKQLGSYKFCLCVVFIFILIDICIIAICSFVYVLISYVIQAIIYILLLIFIHYHVKQLSPVFKEDQFFLRKQFVSELKTIYFNLVLWIICLCIWVSTINNHKSYNFYDNTDAIYIRIAIRFLLDCNMALTSFIFIFVQFAIPFQQFEANKDTLSNRNVLKSQNKEKKGYGLRTKAMLNCIQDKEGYYLLMEHLMSECNVENLLFISEVMHMREKFEDSLLVGSESHANKKSSYAKKNIPKLPQIPSHNAVVTNEAEVEHIVNKMKGEKAMVEMAVINGKRLTIDTTNINDDKTTSNTIHKIFDEHNAQKLTAHAVDFPKLPHSVTMAESMKQNNLFDTVDMIYDNYIVESAAYAVNIAYGTRSKITKIVMQHRASLEHQRKKVQNKGIIHSDVVPSGLSGIIVDVHIFDDAWWELVTMLKGGPWLRFIKTEQFKLYRTSITMMDK